MQAIDRSTDSVYGMVLEDGATLRNGGLMGTAMAARLRRSVIDGGVRDVAYRRKSVSRFCHGDVPPRRSITTACRKADSAGVQRGSRQPRRCRGG
jgi:hypothetical protein